MSVMTSTLTPRQQICRRGCPQELVPKYRVTEPGAGRTPLITEYTQMVLSHRNQDGVEVSRLPLKDIHAELETMALHLDGSGSSNILLSKVSFDCRIRLRGGEEIYKFITFDLRIPGTNTKKETVFSYDFVAELYGGKEELYEAIQHFYCLGRTVLDAEGIKHGHAPAFNPNYSAEDQYIRHTEQLTVAYLAHPEAATMLSNRLRTEIRGQYPDSVEVICYNMGVHMRSTKTCCAPCEYTLTGLKNFSGKLRLNGQQLGFLANFKEACKRPNDQLRFVFPVAPFKLIVTVTASHNDADHKKQPLYKEKAVHPSKLPVYEISVKSSKTYKVIYTTMISHPYSIRRLKEPTSLQHVTVCISGSRQTKGSPGTMEKTRSVRASEGNELKIEGFEKLRIREHRV